MIAFYPGKFQPPHLGHVMLLATIMREYDKVILGISEDTPSIMSRAEVKDIFHIIYPDLEIFLIDGVLNKYENIDMLPKFDILIVAENEDTINWAQRVGIPYKNINRFNILGCDSSELRRLL